MCINPRLKIVPNKSTIYSCKRNVWLKLQCPAVLENYSPVFKNGTIHLWLFKDVHLQQEWIGAGLSTTDRVRARLTALVFSWFLLREKIWNNTSINVSPYSPHSFYDEACTHNKNPLYFGWAPLCWKITEACSKHNVWCCRPHIYSGYLLSIAPAYDLAGGQGGKETVRKEGG